MKKESSYKRVGISFKKDLLENVDTLAEILNVTRSGLISMIVSNEILRRQTEIKKYRHEKEKNLDKIHEDLMLNEEW